MENPKRSSILGQSSEKGFASIEATVLNKRSSILGQSSEKGFASIEATVLNKRSSILGQSSEKGFASIEATVLLVLFSVMLYYAFGFFGIVHTGIVHNIHARTYVFEVFRHRTNLMYFRSKNRVTQSNATHYYNTMTRLHGINTDTRDGINQQTATERPISLGLVLEEEGRDAAIHNRDIYSRIPASDRNRSVSVNPVWILTMYGLCLNSQCRR